MSVWRLASKSLWSGLLDLSHTSYYYYYYYLPETRLYFTSRLCTCSSATAGTCATVTVRTSHTREIVWKASKQVDRE